MDLRQVSPSIRAASRIVPGTTSSVAWSTLISVAIAALLAIVRADVARAQARSAEPWENVRAFLEEDIEFDQYLFPPGEFPSARWRNPERVQILIGPVPLTVEYYDSGFSRVTRAAREGRYGAVARGTTRSGVPIVRFATLYCTTAELDDYSPEVPVAIRPLPSFGISAERWTAYEQNLRRFSFGSLLTFPKHDPDAAIFLAGLAELDTAGSEVLTPRVIDRLWWTRFKRGPGTPSLTIEIRAPANTNSNAATAAVLTRDAIAPEGLDQIRQVASEWTERSAEPMVLLVMHRGSVVFHEAFGRMSDGSAMTAGTRTWMASITKLLMGVLVLQFVDRGLVDLDAPIDRYLPELNGVAPCPLTLRNLLTHTAGLSWAGEWASDWEPSMENRVAHAMPYIEPGRSFRYHRSGYALASRVLERISGETVPQLFRRLIFEPLGMSTAFSENSYGGLYATASDLGRLAQMLLDRGRFGDAEIMSRGAVAAMLPRTLALAPRERERSWGIGCVSLGGNGLSDQAFGHEAASGAVLRIDPVNNLIVVVGRNRVGTSEDEYQRFVGRLLRAVVSGLPRAPESGHD